MDFSTTAALVTGASAGLGRALAIELARRGATVVLVARTAGPLADTVAGIRAAGGRAHAIVADLGDKDAIHKIAGQAQAVAGAIDLLVNNASELGPTPLRLLLDTECEDLEHVLEVGLVGPFRLTKVIAAHMALRGGGTVVNISSDAAVAAYERWGAYGVTKAALDHLTRIWAAELAPHGVKLFAVDPGEMDTAMHRAAIPDADPASLADPALVARRLVELLARGLPATGARIASLATAEAEDLGLGAGPRASEDRAAEGAGSGSGSATASGSGSGSAATAAGSATASGSGSATGSAVAVAPSGAGVS